MMRGRGRPREFDRHQALAEAMLVFWERGYDGTSMSDLMSAMSIRSPSLYAAFGSKERLFLEALELYWVTVGEQIWNELYRHERAWESVQAVLVATARQLTRHDRPKGCLMARLEPLPDSPAVQARLELQRDRTYEMLRNRLLLAQTARELDSRVDCAGLARYYCAVQRGMAMQSCEGVSREVLEDVGLRAMNAWPADPLVDSPG